MLTGLKDVPALPGIYAIVNIRNGKRYVGSSNNMHARLRAHAWMLRCGSHFNDHLSHAWASEGPDAFRCAVIATVGDQALLIEYEQRYIEVLRCADREFGYNASPIAGRPFHTPEVRAKMSAKKKGKVVRRLTPEAAVRLQEASAVVRRGVPLSDAHRAAISAGVKRRGLKLSAEHIERMQAARRANGISDETRARMSAAGKARVRGPYAPHSAETKAKISESLKARARQLRILDGQD